MSLALVLTSALALVACGESSADGDAAATGRGGAGVGVGGAGGSAAGGSGVGGAGAAAAVAHDLIDRYLGVWKMSVTRSGSAVDCFDRELTISKVDSTLTVSERHFGCASGSQFLYPEIVATVESDNSITIAAAPAGEVTAENLSVATKDDKFNFDIYRMKATTGRHATSGGGESFYGGAVLIKSAFEDYDGDGTADDSDNCRITANADQLDSNGNQLGDACELFLTFSVQPPATATNGAPLSPQPEVRVVDFKGDLVDWYAGSVSLTVMDASCQFSAGKIGTSQGSGDGISEAAVGGVATFSDLRISGVSASPVALQAGMGSGSAGTRAEAICSKAIAMP